MSRLQEIEDRLSKATPGPWRHTVKDCKHYMASDFIDRIGDSNGVGLVTCDINQQNADLYATDEDMELIAHAPTDLRDLVAVAKAVREVLLRIGDGEYRMGDIQIIEDALAALDRKEG